MGRGSLLGQGHKEDKGKNDGVEHLLKVFGFVWFGSWGEWDKEKTKGKRQVDQMIQM